MADNNAPGWYPDYAGSGNLRYWDGKRWTNAMQPHLAQAPGQHPGPNVPPSAGPVGHSQPTTGQPPTAWQGVPAVEPASKKPWFKKKRILIPAGVLGSILVLSQLGQSPKEATAQADTTTTSSSSSSSAAAPAPAAPAKAATTAAKPAPVAAAPAAPAEPGVGSTVKEGDIEFTLKSWKCGATRVGSQYWNETAQGMYCIAGFAYKNVGNDPKTFDSSAVTARVGDAKYNSNVSANLALNADNKTFLQQVNPGNVLTAKVAFDVPKGAKIDHVYILDGWTGEGTPLKVG